MNLQSQRELDVTREKLRLLERLHAEAIADTQGDADARDAELESLQRQINRLKEDIVRFQSRKSINGWLNSI